MPEKLSFAYNNGMYLTDGSKLGGFGSNRLLRGIFGGNGGFLQTHIDHLRGRDDLIENYADPEVAMQFVDGADADVVFLSEILGKLQREKIIAALKERGYKTTYFGKGSPLSGKRGYDLYYDEIVMGVKGGFASEEIELLGISKKQMGEHGHGGGLVGARFPGLDCDIFGAHFPLPSKSRLASYREYVQALRTAISNSRSRFKIVIGDTNFSPHELRQRHPELVEGLNLLTPEEPTCNTLWPINLFYSKALDHAWGNAGVRAIDTRIVPARSDHDGIYAEVIFESAQRTMF